MRPGVITEQDPPGCFHIKAEIMKIYLLIIVSVLVFSQACKTKQKADATTGATKTEKVYETPKTVGTVSHQYREDGCATVILIRTDGETLTIIPKDPLPAEFDRDGMNLTFEYRKLKMPNPAGCKVGIPAELSNISGK
jgi:hypothetical protein